MPNAKVLESKKAYVAQLTEEVKNAQGGVLVNYSGITVADDTKLRKELREAGVKYSVVKNTLIRFALNEVGYDALDEHLNGTTAIATCATDPVAPAKILCKFAEDHQAFTVKAGFVDGNVISEKEVEDLAKLPSKDVLVAKMLGSLMSPISGLANVLNADLRGLVVALNAIAEKQSA